MEKWVCTRESPFMQMKDISKHHAALLRKISFIFGEAQERFCIHTGLPVL